jgi:hypothetical protein
LEFWYFNIRIIILTITNTTTTTTNTVIAYIQDLKPTYLHLIKTHRQHYIQYILFIFHIRITINLR